MQTDTFVQMKHLRYYAAAYEPGPHAILCKQPNLWNTQNRKKYERRNQNQFNLAVTDAGAANEVVQCNSVKTKYIAEQIQNVNSVVLLLQRGHLDAATYCSECTIQLLQSFALWVHSM